ncbi:MAG: hypothetical protein V4549_00335 [Bacteroidota bacterium]
MKKNKYYLICFFFICVSINLYGQQFFEGKITYDIKIISKFPKIISDEILSSKFGTIEEYYIQNGNYKSVFNGTDIKMQMYLSKENKIYTQYKDSVASFYWMFANSFNDTIKEIFTINSSETKVLDVDCKIISMNTKSGTAYAYCYNEKYSVNVDLFKNHLYDNWYSYLYIAKSLPLMIEIDNYFFKAIYTAKEIKEQKIVDNFFDIPQSIILIKSPGGIGN